MEVLKNPISVCKWEIAPFPLQSILSWVLKLQNLIHYTLKNCPRKFHAFLLLMVMYQRVQTSGRKNIVKNRSNGVVEHLLKLFVWSLCGLNRARLDRCSPKKCIIWAQRWRPQSFFSCYTQPRQMICNCARWIMTKSRESSWNTLGYIVSSSGIISWLILLKN